MQIVFERPDGTRKVSIHFDKDEDKDFGPSRNRVKSEFLHESKLSTIMKRATKTGTVPVREGAYYGDFTSGDDYLRRLNTAIDLQRYFDGLPSDVRDFFANKPENYLDFVMKPENEDQCVKMGLFKAKVKPKDAPAPEAPEDTKADEQPLPPVISEPASKSAS